MLTIIVLMLHGGGRWYLSVPVKTACIVALVYRPLYRNPNFWLFITAILFAANLQNWNTIDNHKYLITYWCGAIYMSLLANDVRTTLKVNARLLIGLAFLFATAWKVLSSDFLDGTFFHYTLLTDIRFKSLTEIVGGLSGEAFLANRASESSLAEMGNESTTAKLTTTPGVALLSKAMTWWTVLIEGIVAIAFLAPKTSLVSKWRDASLLIFLFTTYAIAPVVGFGWVLATMGIAQLSSNFRYGRILYLAGFLAIQVYVIPFGKIYKFLLM